MTWCWARKISRSIICISVTTCNRIRSVVEGWWALGSSRDGSLGKIIPGGEEEKTKERYKARCQRCGMVAIHSNGSFHCATSVLFDWSWRQFLAKFCNIINPEIEYLSPEEVEKRLTVGAMGIKIDEIIASHVAWKKIKDGKD